MLIGIDIDGVLFRFNEAANASLMDKFGIPDPGPWTSWNYLKDVITPEQWSWLWTPQGTDATFGQMEQVYPNAVRQFGRILKSGHDCHFVTHRDPARAGWATALFLERHFGKAGFEGVHVLRASVKKHSLAPWDVFIDDKAETVMDLLIMTRAHVFAPVRPWNDELLAFTQSRRFTFYDDPRQVADWVLAQ